MKIGGDDNSNIINVIKSEIHLARLQFEAGLENGLDTIVANQDN